MSKVTGELSNISVQPPSPGYLYASKDGTISVKAFECSDMPDPIYCGAHAFYEKNLLVPSFIVLAVVLVFFLVSKVSKVRK